MQQADYARLETLDGEPAKLEGVCASGDLRGSTLEMSVEQRFRNAGPRNIEVIYTLPLPWEAVLLGVDVVLGGQHLTGAVVEKRQAETRYEEALAEGQAAIMLEKNRDASYSLSLGNLAAGETCQVTLRYAQVLQFTQDGLRLLIPTVIAPRYGDAVIDGGLQPHQAPTLDPLAAYPFDIRLRLHGDLAQARVASPTHPIGLGIEAAPAGNVLNVSLAGRGHLDRDFVLTLDRIQESLAVLASDPVAPDQIVVLASFRPQLNAAPAPSALAMKILVDCSGSMTGDSIAAGKRALQAITYQLLPQDHFALSRFGSTVEHRSRGLWPVTDTSRLAAQQWVAGLQADLGGTEMESALISTCALPHGGACDLLLITDGEISAIDRTLAMARDSGHRVFVVGIGSSPAEAHLRRLAEATAGACDFVAPGEAVEPAVRRMFGRLRSPRFGDLRLAWPDDARPRWVSPLDAAVFEGETVHAFAWLDGAPKGAVQLIGTARAGAEPEVLASATLPTELAPGDALARIAAAMQLRSSDADGAVAIALAVAYQVVTERTNFLLVHARAEGEAATEMPELHKVAQMLPAGWGGVGAVRAARPSNVRSEPDYRDMERPAVYRRVHRPTAASSAPDDASPDLDYLDVPVFLRRQAGSPATEPKAACRRAPTSTGEPPDQDYLDRGAFLRRQLEGSGTDPESRHQGPAMREDAWLTPLGLSDWLRSTPEDRWPGTYTGLRQIGIGPSVVDRLELHIAGDPSGPIDEETLVATFLRIFATDVLHEALVRRRGVTLALHALGKDSLWAWAGPGASLPAVDRAAVVHLVAALYGITAETWPSAWRPSVVARVTRWARSWAKRR